MKNYLIKLNKKNIIHSVVRSDGETIKVGQRIQKGTVFSIAHDPEFSSGFKAEWPKEGTFTCIEAIHIP